MRSTGVQEPFKLNAGQNRKSHCQKNLREATAKRLRQLERDTAASRDDSAHDTYGQPPIRVPRIATAVFAVVLGLKVIDPIDVG